MQYQNESAQQNMYNTANYACTTEAALIFIYISVCVCVCVCVCMYVCIKIVEYMVLKLLNDSSFTLGGDHQIKASERRWRWSINRVMAACNWPR